MIIKKPYFLEKITKLTPDVTSFEFKAQDSLQVDFTPGMFAMLTYKDNNTKEEITRAYSIANAPPADYFEFFISMVGGKLTSKLAEAKIGDIYYISAPYGQFKFEYGEDKKYLFLAGGTGIAPFFSMLRYAKSKNKKIDIKMIYSVKYPYDIINKSELDSFSNIGLEWHATVTRYDNTMEWDGLKGHIDSGMIKNIVNDYNNREAYICGPPAFVDAMKKALDELGVDKTKIKAEFWG